MHFLLKVNPVESGNTAAKRGNSARPQEHNRYRFCGACREHGGRYLRVVTLEDKITIHNAFLHRGFRP